MGTSLMKGLNETQSRYIRCVKPNTKKKKLLMEHITTLEQLRCAGVVAAVTISRSAYPSKLENSDVIHRYSMLNADKPKNGYPDQASEIEGILSKVLKKFDKKKKDGSISKAFAIGKTRIYFKAGCLEYLESERGKVWHKWAVVIQAPARGFITRLRIIRERKKQKKLERRQGKKWKKAAIKIQAVARGFLQRPKYQQALKGKKEEEDLANQLNDMKERLAEAEEQRKRELEDAKFQFEQEMEEYKEKLEDQLRSESKKAGGSAQHKTLIDESGKIIEYLRKENMKLRQQCESMKRDYKSLKENNSRLMEANRSASSSFNQLNDHAKGLNATNARLIKNVDTYK